MKVCPNPYNYVEVGRSREAGKIYFKFCCETYIDSDKIQLKKLTDFYKFKEFVEKVQEAASRGQYPYCRKSVCPYFLSQNGEDKFGQELQDMQNNKLLEVRLLTDDSCNLHCTSCRESIKAFSLKEGEGDYKDLCHILDVIGKDNIKHFMLGGSGEPLVSYALKKLFPTFTKENYPNLQAITIQTNGQLIVPFLKGLESSQIDGFPKILFDISVDAGTEQTYRTIRRGGELSRIEDGIKLILSPDKKLDVDICTLTFTVQKRNLEEIYRFYLNTVKWIPKNKPVTIIINRVQDWGTGLPFEELSVNSEECNQKALEQILRIVDETRGTNITVASNFLNNTDTHKERRRKIHLV